MNKLNSSVKKGRAIRGETGSLAAKPMNTINTLRKGDPTAIAIAAAEIAPPGRIQTALKFIGDAEPYFSLTKLGSSRLFPSKLFSLARACLAIMFFAIGLICLKQGSTTGLLVSVPFALLYIALAWMSFMSSIRSGKMAMLKESFIVGAIYQTLASVALWMAPIAIIAIVRNVHRASGERKHIMQYVACILPAGAFMLDCTFLGAAPYFRKLVVIAPLLAEAIIIAVNFAFGGIKRPAAEPIRRMFNLVLLIVAIWAVASAFLAVAISRVAGCCGKKHIDETNDDVNEVAPVDVDIDVENGESRGQEMTSAS